MTLPTLARFSKACADAIQLKIVIRIGIDHRQKDLDTGVAIHLAESSAE